MQKINRKELAEVLDADKTTTGQYKELLAEWRKADKDKKEEILDAFEHILGTLSGNISHIITFDNNCIDDIHAFAQKQNFNISTTDLSALISYIILKGQPVRFEQNYEGTIN